jgi:putative transposase
LNNSNSDNNRSNLTVRCQCLLLGINRSNIYYKPRNIEEISDLCNQIYELWQKYQFFGYRRITAILNEQSKDGIKINHKRTLRLMRLIGIKALYPKKRTTIINKADYKYPYLLKDLIINQPNQVWSTDITYIKTGVGFVYLIALIDWYSRFITSWKLCINMEADNCIEVLRVGVDNYPTPRIINSDQGSQFTGNDWISELKKANIQISMDGKGRWIDNVRIERFWRTVKQEQIYLNPPDSLEDLRRGIGKFIKFYNYQRPHQSLSYKTPSQIYYGDDSKRKAIKF